MGKKSGGAGLRRLLDAIPAPVYAIDAKRRFAYCNSAFQEWTGYSLDDISDIRCDYHSAQQEEPIRRTVDSLCPPPEVFAGQSGRGRIVLAGGDGEIRERSATFIPLCPTAPIPAAEPTGALIIVSSSDNDPIAESLEEPLPEPESLHVALARLRSHERENYASDRLLGQSPVMQRVQRQVELAMRSSANVLVIGAPGSGREHVARTIYYGGQHDSGSLVPLSCDLLDAELLESTLSVISRQTREMDESQPNALLLLEADQMNLTCQELLASWLSADDTPMRVIACARQAFDTPHSPAGFRTDLAYALSTLEIRLPTLQDRMDDVPLIAQAILEESNRLGGTQLSGFTQEAMDRLVGHTYHENIDELRRTVQQACANANGTHIQPGDLPAAITWAFDRDAHLRRKAEAIDLDEFLEEMESELIRRAMSVSEGNRTQAAKLLGISRARLLRRLAEHPEEGTEQA